MATQATTNVNDLVQYLNNNNEGTEYKPEINKKGVLVIAKYEMDEEDGKIKRHELTDEEVRLWKHTYDHVTERAEGQEIVKRAWREMSLKGERATPGVMAVLSVLMDNRLEEAVGILTEPNRMPSEDWG